MNNLFYRKEQKSFYQKFADLNQKIKDLGCGEKNFSLLDSFEMKLRSADLSFFKRKSSKKTIFYYVIAFICASVFVNFYFSTSSILGRISWAVFYTAGIGIMLIKTFRESEEIFLRRKEFAAIILQEFVIYRQNSKNHLIKNNERLDKLIKDDFEEIKSIFDEKKLNPFLKIIDSEQIKKYWASVKDEYISNLKKSIQETELGIGKYDLEIEFLKTI